MTRKNFCGALTAERLRELLSYDPATGDWTRLTRPPRSKFLIGSKAGGRMIDGYWRVKVDGKAYKGHRLAVFYMTGEWPAEEVDHRNLHKSENEWGNLRPSSRRLNEGNKPRAKLNTSGFKGVINLGSRYPNRPWAAKIRMREGEAPWPTR